MSAIGLSCMLYSQGRNGPPDEGASIAAIRTAYEAGCTYFDTSEHYGRKPFHPGHNEELLGRALGGHRQGIIISSKFHINWSDFERTHSVYQVIRDHLDRSLKNLGTDYLDLYFMHRVNPQVSTADVAAAMGKLIDEGLIRGWGMSQVPVQTIAEGHEALPLTAVEDAFSLARTDADKDILPYCQRSGIGFVAFSPIASYYLETDRPKPAKSDDPNEAFLARLAERRWVANRPITYRLQELSRANHASPAQISLAWMLHKYPNLVPVPGSKHAERIYENLAGADIILTDEEVADIDRRLEYSSRHDAQVVKEMRRGRRQTKPKAKSKQGMRGDRNRLHGAGGN
ncbi:aldo/keto reductase [Bifidobacterium xylocopae]|uniref:aldo/keto reductase n=1 Tax=Bifidobacterium xylocopae TaxID=2493119 RepID=UPI00137522C7|nr:aldo/keto reductase [Bifidobacterium xylocopae]